MILRVVVVQGAHRVRRQARGPAKAFGRAAFVRVGLGEGDGAALRGACSGPWRSAAGRHGTPPRTAPVRGPAR